MSEVLYSAGEPGASRCSETATGPMPDARGMVALQCAYEIQAWATMIAQRMGRDEMDAPDLWLRGAVIRLDDLACAVMTACNPGEPIADAERLLLGPKYLHAAQGGAA